MTTIYSAIGMIFAILFIESQSFALIQLTLQGSSSANSWLLKTQDRKSISGSVAVGIGNYVRVGVTHREGVDKEEGYERLTAEHPWIYKKTKSYMTADSLDFTVIVYNGQIFVPFVQIGGIVKEYEFYTEQDGLVTQDKGPLPLSLNKGVGVNIRLNQSFSLKLSYTRSTGLLLKDPDQENPTQVWDDYSAIGISYNI